MAFEIDPDLYRSASYRNMAASLIAPLQTGAVDSEIALEGGNRIMLNRTVREPLLLIAPKANLDRVGLRVISILDPDGGAISMQQLEFAPYTEAGAFLLLHRPAIDPQTRSAAGFTIELALEFFDEERAEVAVADSTPESHLTVRLFQGTLAALIYIMGTEKSRIRRQAREISAMRVLSRARRDALDRFGADLAVPRLHDEIIYNATRREIVSVHKAADGNPIREGDGDFYRRLKLYMPWLVPTPGTVQQVLNGPGGPGDNNAGPMGQIGLRERFRLIQQNNELAFAVHMSATSPELLDNLLKFIRDVHLVWPSQAALGNAIHAARPMASSARSHLNQVRKTVSEAFTFADTMAIAPELAELLAQVARCKVALGMAGSITVKRAQDAAGGSRYQLGLGIDVGPISAADLDAMHTALQDTNRAPNADHKVEGLLKLMQSKPAVVDREGAWLFQACGIRTVHRVDLDTVYLSHLPTFGLVVNRVGAPDAVGAGTFEARYHAAMDPGSNVVLASAIASATAAWLAEGGEAFTVLTDAAARTAWDVAVVVTPGAQTTFKAAGLPALAQNASAVASLKILPEELIETIQLGPILSARIIAGEVAAVQSLQRLTELLREGGATSVLPLMVTGNRVHLVIGVIGLPEAGINLSDRRSTGFHWYVVPVEGDGGSIKAIGARTAYVPSGKGINAIIAVGYARRGFADPYEFRVELPDGANLNLIQYEYLMNLLERVCPAGVEVNTFSIRQQHVDLDGNGAPEPLPPSVLRSYRRFHRPRHRGESTV